MRHQGLPIDPRRWASLYWSLLVFVRENPPPVLLENYSAEKRWSGFSSYLHVQLNFSVNRPILWQWNGILRSWFSTLIAEKVCLTTGELNAFENVRAIFFCDGVILVVGRLSGVQIDNVFFTKFESITVRTRQSIRVWNID